MSLIHSNLKADLVQNFVLSISQTLFTLIGAGFCSVTGALLSFPVVAGSNVSNLSSILSKNLTAPSLGSLFSTQVFAIKSCWLHLLICVRSECGWMCVRGLNGPVGSDFASQRQFIICSRGCNLPSTPTPQKRKKKSKK